MLADFNIDEMVILTHCGPELIITMVMPLTIPTVVSVMIVPVLLVNRTLLPLIIQKSGG